MNQILVTKNNKKVKLNKNFFKLQFLFSFMISVLLICSIIYTLYSIKESEKESAKLVGNYNIYKLYSDFSYFQDNTEISTNIFGTIEIPKLDISYPIFSNLSEENLKLSPCRFYGPSLTENGNICIAGHNYDNNKFFSNLDDLNLSDNIIIYDNNRIRYLYKIFDIYEVKENDLSPIFSYDLNAKTLTLITCNNLNKNRLIIKSTQLKIFTNKNL